MGVRNEFGSTVSLTNLLTVSQLGCEQKKLLGFGGLCRAPLTPNFSRAVWVTPPVRVYGSVALRFLRHAHAMMRELREREAVLRTRDDFARKSVKAPSLLDPGVSRASVPPLYTQIYLRSCSVALRPPLTWPSMRARGGAPWGRKPPLRQNRQPSLRCTPRTSPGRQHSDSSPTQTLGHACINAEPEITIFAPAAPKLKVLR